MSARLKIVATMLIGWVLLVSTAATAKPECVLERFGSGTYQAYFLTHQQLRPPTGFRVHHQFVEKFGAFQLLVEIMQRTDGTFQWSYVFGGVGWPQPASLSAGFNGYGFSMGLRAGLEDLGLHCRDLNMKFCTDYSTEHFCRSIPFEPCSASISRCVK